MKPSRLLRRRSQRRSRTRRAAIAALAAGALLAGATAPASAAGYFGIPTLPSPPARPASGPGGSDGPYGCHTQRHVGWGGTAYDLFLPDCAAAGTPDGPHPVVVLLHGFSALDPMLYGDWIRHLTAHGVIVVFPQYQATLLDEYQVDNAIVAVRSAMAELSKPGMPPIDTSRIIYAGHSGGGGIAVNLAAVSGDGLVPVPSAVYAVEPGLNMVDRSKGASPDPYGFVRDLTRTPSTVKVTFAVGDQDTFVNDESAYQAWIKLGHLPTQNRTWQVMRSDWRNDTIATVGSHLIPLGGGGLAIPGLIETNAQDFLLWATLDNLIACGATTPAGGCPTPTSIGDWRWSDGRPAQTALVTHDAASARTMYNAGTDAAYQVAQLLVSVRPLCDVLGPAVCGSKPTLP